MTDAETGRSDLGLVVRVDYGSCLLLPGTGPPLEATVRGALMGPAKSLDNTLVVGDLVRYEPGPGRAVVTEVAERRNHFSRRAPGDRACEQVVASNLDQVIVVVSVADPEFRPGFVDRVLCQSEHAGIPARIVINKVDRAEPGGVEERVADYEQAGYPVHAVSAKNLTGIDALRHACRARRSLFVGHSGVGKSTLLNALVPALNLLARQVNLKTGKGRHTTTAAWLVRSEPGLELIDTPGVRTFGLWGVGARDLEQAYVEFRRHLGACRFGDCHHHREPGCAVKAAVEAGRVARRRYDSFLKLRAELEREAARS